MTQEVDKNSEIVERLTSEYHGWVRQYRTQELNKRVAFTNKHVIEILVRVLGRSLGATEEEIEADLGKS